MGRASMSSTAKGISPIGSPAIPIIQWGAPCYGGSSSTPPQVPWTEPPHLPICIPTCGHTRSLDQACQSAMRHTQAPAVAGPCRRHCLCELEATCVGWALRCHHSSIVCQDVIQQQCLGEGRANGPPRAGLRGCGSKVERGYTEKVGYTNSRAEGSNRRPYR